MERERQTARGRSLLSTAAACLLALPVGYAVAHEIAGQGADTRAATEEVVPADGCPPAVNRAFDSAGLPRDEYVGGCPSVEQAQADAAHLSGLLEQAEEQRESVERLRDSGVLGEESSGGPLVETEQK